MPLDIDAFNLFIKNRRSVFPNQFVPGKKIDDTIVRQILENATWAPTHGHTEPWHFVVFTEEGLKKLADFQSELYKEDAGEHFNEGKYNKLKTQPLLASHIIAIGMKRSEAKRIPEIEEIEAVACAVQNIYLTVNAYGLGGYWTTGGITYHKSAKPFFGLENEDKLLGFFYLGHVQIPATSGKRKPLDEKLVWVKD
jgi:nitroreductase